MKPNNQKGSALIFALILLLVLSAMAGSLMFLSNSETYSSMNYRMMTEARYGAEAGVHAASNFIMNAYVPPTTCAGCNFAGFTTNVYPVTDTNGQPIYLSTLSTQSANYPNGAMQTAFATAMNANQPLQQAGRGANTVTYSASAQLMSMVSITPFGTTQPMTIQTWQITAHGNIGNVQNGEAEVVTTLERYISPAFAYAAFADGSGCGQITFTGNGSTNGYDSSSLSTVGGVVQAPTGANLLGYGGNIGTDGNDNSSAGNPTIHGTLSTPNSGFGVCSSGNVTAYTGNLNQVTGGLVQLPQAVTFPAPSITPPTPGSPNITTGQQLGPCAASPCNYGDITLSGNETLTLTPGTYKINSLSISGNANITVAPDPVTGQYGPIILNVANQQTTANNSNTPITITGNAINNPTYDPSLLQIVCCASGTPANPTIQIAGNGASAAVVYAPNATVDLKGNATFYGSVIASQLLDVGNGAIYYDMKLRKKLFTVGNYVLNAFTWNKY